MKIIYYIPFLFVLLTITACKPEKPQPNEPETETEPYLIFKIKLDPNQERLDIFGNPIGVAAGHGAQTPAFNKVAIHSIELVPNENTQFAKGEMVYNAEHYIENGYHTVYFDKLSQVKNGEVTYKIPLREVKAGTYEYCRSSVNYQNYDINFRANGMDLIATVGSFVGHNTYITSHKIKNQTITLNESKKQGYYAVEIPAIPPYYAGEVIQGQSQGTTVVNPISTTSPIPEGSCTVTGKFPQKFTITGSETKDIVIELSFSINNSFEWTDAADNNIYEPLDGDAVVDMGLRGLVPTVIE